MGMKKKHQWALPLAVWALLLIGVAGAVVQQGRTSSVVVLWDDYMVLEDVTPGNWQAWLDYEVRERGNVVARESVQSDCAASVGSAGSGQCGSPAGVTWGELDPGGYQVWVRLRWTNGEQEFFGHPEEPLPPGDDLHFYYLEDLVVEYSVYLPILYK